VTVVPDAKERCRHSAVDDERRALDVPPPTGHVDAEGERSRRRVLPRAHLVKAKLVIRTLETRAPVGKK